jgi:hypothetical protein
MLAEAPSKQCAALRALVELSRDAPQLWDQLPPSLCCESCHGNSPGEAFTPPITPAKLNVGFMISEGLASMRPAVAIKRSRGSIL